MCQADQVLAGSKSAFSSLADAAPIHRNVGPDSVNDFLSTEHELNTELREVYRCSHTALCCLRVAPQPAPMWFWSFKGWAAGCFKSQKGRGQTAGQHSHSPGPAMAEQDTKPGTVTLTGDWTQGSWAPGAQRAPTLARQGVETSPGRLTCFLKAHTSALRGFWKSIRRIAWSAEKLISLRVSSSL